MEETKTLRFEDALTELEKAASDMRSDNLGLEESMQRFQDGMKYYERCRELLDSAKQKIECFDKEQETIKPF